MIVAPSELELWEVQLPIYDELRQAFTDGHTNVAIQAPTGFGKTSIFTKMVFGAWQKKKVTYIVAHTDAIVQQISARLEQYGIPHSFIAAGRCYIPWETIQVCMIQSLAPRMADGRAPEPELVVIDEAHHCVAKSYDCLFDIPGAWVIGVSATWWRMNGQGFQHRFTYMVGAPGLKYLTREVNPKTDRTYLVPPWVYGIPGAKRERVKKNKDGEYNEASAEQEIENAKIFGDAVRHYIQYCNGESAILFCQSVKHAQLVAGEFQDAGISCKSIDGTMGKAAIRAVVNAYNRGEVSVLSTCMLVGEGFDVPKISAVFVLKFTASLVAWLQMIGRGLRAYSDKTHCKVFDHTGMLEEHGHPIAPRTWSLDGKTDIIDDGEEDYKQCSHCYLWIPRSQSPCEGCGYIEAKGNGVKAEQPPTVNRYGMLVLMEEEEPPPVKRPERKATRGEIGKTLALSETWGDWWKWCEEHGYKQQMARIHWEMKVARQRSKKK